MNLRHLRNFWTVARMGGVAKAAERLDLTSQTVSGQVRQLEEDLGVALFRPAGRGLELTEAGRMALSYADEILQLGDEMKSALASRQRQPLPVLRVGITDVVPKTIAYRLLAPVGGLPEPVRLVCREGRMDMLLSELALHRLDLVVADRPMPAGLSIRGHGRLRRKQTGLLRRRPPEFAPARFPGLPRRRTAARAQPGGSSADISTAGSASTTCRRASSESSTTGR